MQDTFINQSNLSISKLVTSIMIVFGLIINLPAVFAYDTDGYKTIQKSQTVNKQTQINNSKLPGANIGEQAGCVCSGGECDPPGCDSNPDPDNPICICGGDGEGGWSCNPAGCDGSSSQVASPSGASGMPQSVIKQPTSTLPVIRNPTVDPEKINSTSFPGD